MSGTDTSGINTPSDVIADLQVGPTDQGMVRIFVAADGVELPMDFTPDEAMDIATELMAAAEVAAQTLKETAEQGVKGPRRRGAKGKAP